jgi:enamine deaminase RidA (YjgF/YER057c/UK114 family)
VQKEHVNPASWQEKFGYTQGCRVDEAQRLLFVAGQIALDEDGQLVGEGDFEAQTRQVFANMGRVLELAGMSFENVVQVGVFMTDIGQLRTYARVGTSSSTPPRHPPRPRSASPVWLCRICSSRSTRSPCPSQPVRTSPSWPSTRSSCSRLGQSGTPAQARVPVSAPSEGALRPLSSGSLAEPCAKSLSRLPAGQRATTRRYLKIASTRTRGRL